MAYPIAVDFEDQLENRNRLTTFFRPILAIPHVILVGGGALGGGGSNLDRGNDPFNVFIDLLFAGVLNIAVAVTTVIAWFAILFTGRMPDGLWNFGAFVVGWQLRAYAYFYLLTDEYPPFGDVPEPHAYPARIALERPAERNRLTVFFRLFMLIPHAIVLAFLSIAAVIVAIIGWFAILFTANFPQGLYGFLAGMLAWQTRVSAYGFLLTDEYPPFSLDRDPVPPAGAAAMPAAT